MGTNFYAQQLPTPEEAEKIKQLVSEGNYLELKEYLQEVTKRYHIGKRSAGWQFIFATRQDDYTDSPWQDNLQSIKDYLSNDTITIMDEYGEHFTPEQFWNEEVGDSLYNNPEKYINIDQYYQKYPSHRITCIDSRQYSKDGLEFCTSEDWC